MATESFVGTVLSDIESKRTHSFSRLIIKVSVVFLILISVFYWKNGLEIQNSMFPTFTPVSESDMYPLQSFDFILQNTNNTTLNKGCFVKNVTSENACDYVRNNSECNKYIVLHYCTFSRVHTLYYLLIFVWLFLIFYVMGDTAQSYFVPSLIRISDYLKLSPNVAGVTLLALGNGINDIASIAIGVIFAGSTGFAVGGPVGSSLFITTIILGLVLLLSVVEVGRFPFFRDLSFFLVTVVFVFYMFMMQRVAVWESVICLIFYCFYVFVVLIGPLIKKLFQKIGTLIGNNIARKKQPITNVDLGEGLLSGDVVQAIDEDSDDDWTGGWKSFPKFAGRVHNHHEPVKEKGLTRPIESVFNMPLQKSLNVGETKEGEESIVHSEYFTMTEEGEEPEKERNFCLKIWDKFIASIGWNEKPWYSKITFVIYEWPWNIARNMTCFRADDCEWNKWYAACVPIFSPLWIFFAINPEFVVYMIGGKFPIIVIFILLGIPASLLLLISTRSDRPPIFQPLLVVLCFVLSSFWIYWGARELLDVLSTLGILWNFSDAILAVTILAWGNSIGDAVSNIVVARQGHAKMAVGAIFGGPLLNLLIGLGIAFTFNETSLKTGCYPLEADANVSIGFIFLIVSILTSIIVIPINNNIVHKVYGVYLILFYIVYVILSILAVAVPQFGKVFIWNVGPGCKK